MNASLALGRTEQFKCVLSFITFIEGHESILTILLCQLIINSVVECYTL